MARLRECPNCGQLTGRTEDWACQWCGYPLLSGSYKKIPKTFGQLKGEAIQDAAAAQVPVSSTEGVAWQTATEEEPAQESPVVAEVLEDDSDPLPEAPVPSAPVADEAVTPLPPDEPSGAEAPGPQEMTVHEMCAEYTEQGMAGHEKFQGRAFRLKGIVDIIIVKDVVARYQLAINDPNPHPLGSVFCNFAREDAPALVRLKVGQAVTVEGSYFGFTSNIVLSGCSVVAREAARPG